MSRTFKVTRRIEFGDTDMGGIVHFPRYFHFMESAEHRFLESLGWPPHRPAHGTTIGWPRVSVGCDYKAPLRYADEVSIEVRIRRRSTRSITYDFLFELAGQAVAHGTMTTVCIDATPGAPFKAVPIPDDLARKLDEHC